MNHHLVGRLLWGKKSQIWLIPLQIKIGGFISLTSDTLTSMCANPVAEPFSFNCAVAEKFSFFL